MKPKDLRSPLSTPPSGPVRWSATGVHNSGHVETCCVDATTWFQARREASVRMGICKDRIIIVMVPVRLA